MWPRVVEWAGCLLVLASGTGLGACVASRLGRRPRELAALRVALQVLLTEIDYGLTPLPAALRRAAAAVSGPVAGLMRIWADVLARGEGVLPAEALRAALTRSDLALGPADVDVLQGLAAALGASGRQDQVRHLGLALRRLEVTEAEAREAAAKGQRLAWWLGVLGSLAVVLLAV